MAIINIPVILILSNTAMKALKDYERQLKMGMNLVFKSKDIGMKRSLTAGSSESSKKYKVVSDMYYVPDGTKECGYYECRKCGNRFLSLQTMKHIPCPDCEQEIDYEIGPDESLEDVLDTAELLQKIEGEEEVEKMDALLSLAITGGDCNWI